jgi:hypothetical protein
LIQIIELVQIPCGSGISDSLDTDYACPENHTNNNPGTTGFNLILTPLYCPVLL